MSPELGTAALRQDLLARAGDLTPLPVAVTHLAQVLHDPESSVEETCSIITQDPVLTANVLREANSSWTGRAEVATIDRAFVLLGRARLLMLAARGSVGERFQPALPEYGLAKGELWQHSVASSVAASAVRDHSRVDPGGEALTAALLHDFAKLVLCDFIDLPDRDAPFFEQPLTTFEHNQLNIDHAELGGYICRSWGLPASICDAIALHHTEEHDEVPSAAHAVAVVVAHEALGGGSGFFAVDRAEVEPSMAALRLDHETWDQLVVETQTTIGPAI